MRPEHRQSPRIRYPIGKRTRRRWHTLRINERILCVRRKRKTKTKPANKAGPGRFANQPFRGLAAAGERPIDAEHTATKGAQAKPAVSSGATANDLFESAMVGVTPLSAEQKAVVPPAIAPHVERPVADPDAEALAELSDLVSGLGPFDITDTTEFLEGAVSGVDSRLVRRLRRGEFAFRRYLDLHGMTVAEAKVAVDEFLVNTQRSSERCVLIVHGRGLNSRDNVPVLKRNLVDWLVRGRWARSVLAFTSARPCDGGAGAVYVLLRKQRDSKKQIRVTEGAKW